MTSTQLIALVAAALAAALVTALGYAPARGEQKSQVATEQHLKARQSEIQSIIDQLGGVLKNPSTTPGQGKAAAEIALAELRRLNPDGSLDPLIADTEEYVAEWLASRQSA
jgi:hypothetical protein